MSLWQRVERHGAALHGHDRWRRTNTPLAEVAGSGRSVSRPSDFALRRYRALVGADSHWAGDAEPRQFDHRLSTAYAIWSGETDIEAGSWAAQSNLDPRC